MTKRKKNIWPNEKGEKVKNNNLLHSTQESND
jgi:hypothetical protein